MRNSDSLKKIINNHTVATFTVITFVVLVVVNLVGTNILSTQGYVVSEAETETRRLEKENEILSVKIEEATRLGNLEEIAEQRGFIKTKSIVFVPTPQNLASR